MTSQILFRAARLVLALLLLAFPTRADPLEAPVVLIATSTGANAFEEAVVLAVPIGGGVHFGFVLNRPTETTVAALFPNEEAARGVSARVYAGGPLFANGLFALVGAAAAPAGLRRITPELSLALESGQVERVIAERPQDARFYVGMMVWTSGQLEAEVEGGAWQVVAPDAGIVLSVRPESLWPRLAARARNASGMHAIAHFGRLQ